MTPTIKTVATVAISTLPSATNPAITKTMPSATIQPHFARSGSIPEAVKDVAVVLDMTLLRVLKKKNFVES